MHLQQTKLGSRKSGGPQYFFHGVTPTVKDYLRRKGACPVVLVTPYGIASSPFMAVGRDSRLTKDGQIVAGKAEHDRIQQSGAANSIGEEMRSWYGITHRLDFERIDVDVAIHQDGHFILTPTAVRFRGRTRSIAIERAVQPLSFNRRHESALWRDQIQTVKRNTPSDLDWCVSQLQRVVHDHRNNVVGQIHEADIQRTSGAFSKLGLQLGPYLVKGYDCDSVFSFESLPPYRCSVEIKKDSRGFKYQMARYKPLPRAVVLCIDHNLRNQPEHIDVIELSHLVSVLSART